MIHDSEIMGPALGPHRSAIGACILVDSSPPFIVSIAPETRPSRYALKAAKIRGQLALAYARFSRIQDILSRGMSAVITTASGYRNDERWRAITDKERISV